MKPRDITRKMLEEEPRRESWQEPTVYDWIYLLPSKKKHDSGWHLICIVGQTGDVLEQAAWCDDICWKHVPHSSGWRGYTMRTDMLYPSGIVRCWGNGLKFEVGMSLSSTDVKTILVPQS